MNRRVFMRSLIAAGAGSLLAPKIHILPPADGWRKTGALYSFADIVPMGRPSAWEVMTLTDILADVNHLFAAIDDEWREVTVMPLLCRAPGESDDSLKFRAVFLMADLDSIGSPLSAAPYKHLRNRLRDSYCDAGRADIGAE